jgi:ABC-2 type transport system ATP-binding protein
MNSIEVNNLTKRFGDFTAVDRVSFSVAPGEIFGFLGPNGSGKSTTIRMLCGIISPSEGRATVAGHDITASPELVKQNIGYMSQKFSLYSELSAEENFTFFSGIYGKTSEEIGELRQKVFGSLGLLGLEGRIAGDLPGGYRQRLALACAISHGPKVLFLDEPTAGVDPAARRSFWSIIQSLAAEGMTIFVTTHYMDEAEYAGRLAFIYNGKIVALDTPEKLKQDYRQKLYQLYGPPPLEMMEKISLVKEACQVAPFGNALHISCRPETDVAPRIKALLGDQKYTLEQITPSLEDVFVALIDRPLATPLSDAGQPDEALAKSGRGAGLH